jgi:hypothetical protein
MRAVDRHGSTEADHGIAGASLMPKVTKVSPTPDSVIQRRRCYARTGTSSAQKAPSPPRPSASPGRVQSSMNGHPIGRTVDLAGHGDIAPIYWRCARQQGLARCSLGFRRSLCRSRQAEQHPIAKVQGIDLTRPCKFHDLVDNEIGHRIKSAALEIERVADRAKRRAHSPDVPRIYYIVSKRHGVLRLASDQAALLNGYLPNSPRVGGALTGRGGGVIRIGEVTIESKDRMLLSFLRAGARASLSHRRLRKNLGRRCCSDKHERENSDDGSVEQAPVRATLQSTPIGPEAARRAGER